MPPSEFQTSEILDPGSGAGDLGLSAPNARVEAQISNADVSQAHQYFTPKTGSSLPDLSIHGDNGATALSSTAGHEQAIGSLAHSGNAALGAVGSGAEQAVNPLIQMVMKMPGLTGSISSFFEFLSTLIHGNLMEAFNPALWAEQAMGAVNALASNAQHLAISLDFIKATNPGLAFNGITFHPADSIGGMHMHSDSLSAGSLDAANVGAPDQNVNLEQAIFEKTSNYKITEYHQDSLLGSWRHPQDVYVRGDANAAAYRPTMGGYQSQAGTTTATTTTHSAAPAQHAAQAKPQPASHAKAVNHHRGGEQAATHHPHHINHTQPHDATSQQIASAPATENMSGSGPYTIQPGDNLWSIAQRQLGDGSRWGEIFKGNAEVIGNNPDLIYPGTTINLPGHSGSADLALGGGEPYTVQTGDSLWSIAKQHLGSGSHWNQIYQANQNIIGANPDILQPGQHLNLSGSELATSAVDANTEMSRSFVDGTQAQTAAMANDAGNVAATAAGANSP